MMGSMRSEVVVISIVCAVAALAGLAMIFLGEVFHGACLITASLVPTTIAALGGRTR